MKLVRWMVFGLISLGCCACSEDEASPGGNAGSSGAAGSGGTGGSAGNGGSAGDGGTAGSGGSAGSGGGAGGTSGGAGGTGGTAGSSAVTCETYQSEEICSASCADFPVTLDLGSSIAFGVTGALICDAENSGACFGTNNTYSDGPAACAGQQALYAWLDTNGGNRGFNTQSGWHVKSSSAGTIESTSAQLVTNVPDATTITAVVNDGPLSAPGANDYEVVFAFAGTAVTFTSVTPQ